METYVPPLEASPTLKRG